MVADGSALDEVLAEYSPEELETLDHHLGCSAFERRGLLEGSGARLGVEAAPNGGLVLLRRVGETEAVRVRTLPFDPATPVRTNDERADAVLQALETATESEHGLQVFSWYVIVEGDPGPGQLSLVQGREQDPDVVVGDEIGLRDEEATRALRTAFLHALRRARPLRLVPEHPGAAAAVEAAIASDAERTGREPAALMERFAGLRSAESIEREIMAHVWELEDAAFEADPDADDPPPSALASLAPLDPFLTDAFIAKVQQLHPPVPPPPPANEAEALLRRWGEGDDIADEAVALEPARLGWLIDRLGRHTNVDHAWHQLFALARSCPQERPRIEAVLEPWADGARLMPRTWFAEIQAGRFDPVHRLVRELMLDENEWHLLLQPGVEESLGGLSGLGLHVPPDAMPQLLAHEPDLPKLRTLQCRAMVWTDALARGMASTSAWPRLATLALQNNPMQPEHLAELWVGASFPGLETLEVFNATDLRSPLAPPLPLLDVARALGGRALQRPGFAMRFTGMGIDAEGLRAFVRQPAAQALSGLDVIASELDAPEIGILAEAPLSLESLTLHTGKAGPQGARALAGAPWRSRLRDLSVCNQGIGDEAMADLLESLAAAPMRRLAILHNHLGPRTTAVLSELRWPTLESLELSHNRLTDEGVARVLANPSLTSLRRFEALGTGASEATARALADGSFPALHTVELGDEVGERAASVLAEAMRDDGWLPALKRLQLRGVDDEAMRALDRRGVYVTNAAFA